MSLSPDDRQAAVTLQGESRDLWITSLERQAFSRLTASESTEFDPIWSHDGKELFYVFDRPAVELQRIPEGLPISFDWYATHLPSGENTRFRSSLRDLCAALSGTARSDSGLP